MGINIRKKLRAIPKQIHDTLEAFKNYWNQFTDKQKNLILATSLGVIGIIVWSLYGVFEFPLNNDMGIYLYGGKELLEGNIPYVAVFDVKPPLTFIVSAFGLLFLNSTFQLSPILVSRIVMLLFGAGTIFFVYLLVYHLLKNRTYAILTGIILISFTGMGWAAISGRPKTLMVFFSISCLYMLIRKKWLISGILGSLSALAWQPGALLPLVVILYSLTDKQNRKEQLLKSIIGAALPFIVVILFFYIMGGLNEFINQSLLFIITFKGSLHWGFQRATTTFTYSIFYYYGTEILFFILAILGFIIFSYKNRKILINLKNPLPFIYLFFIPLGFYSLYDFQGLWDLVPLLPFIALFASYFLIKLAKKIGNLIQNKTRYKSKKTTTYVTAIIIILSAFYGITPILGEPQPVLKNITDKISEKGDLGQLYQMTNNGNLIGAMSIIIEDIGFLQTIKMLFFTIKSPGITYDEQIEMAEYIQANSDPSQRLLFIGVPDLLSISNRKNFNRYVLYPADVLYMQVNGELASYRQNVINEKPPLIISGNRSRTYNATTTIFDFYLPKELELSEFIYEEYEIGKQSKNYIIFKKK